MTIPDADGVIHGCRDSRSGALSVIDSDTQQCPRGATPLTWNQVGPPGPQGPAGAPGPAGPQGPAGVSHANFHSHTNIDMPLAGGAMALTADPGDPRARNLDAQLAGVAFVGVATVAVRNTGSAARQLAFGDRRDRPTAIVTIAPGDVATVTVPLVNQVGCWGNDQGPATPDSPLHVIAFTVLTIEVTDVWAIAL
jgi:hypothetical protein